MQPVRSSWQWSGGLGLTVLALAGLSTYTYVTRPRENAHLSSCPSKLKQIALACAQYMQDYDDHFPLVTDAKYTGWADRLQPYGKSWSLLQCPHGQETPLLKGSDYFFNARLVGRQFPDSAPLTIAFGDGIDNASTRSSLKELPPLWRTDETSPAYRDGTGRGLEGGAHYAFVDGHVKWLKPAWIHAVRPANAASPAFGFAVARARKAP